MEVTAGVIDRIWWSPDSRHFLVLHRGIWRSYVYGLALAGEEGVREVIQNLKADFDLTMGLTGCRSIEEIGRDCLVEAGARIPGR